MDTYSENDGLLRDPSNTKMVEIAIMKTVTSIWEVRKCLLLHPGFLSPDTSIVPTIFTEFRIRGETGYSR